jgi:hypothetical protein
MPIDASSITRAYLVKSEDEANESARVLFDFNPLTLSYSLEASQQQQNTPNKTGQTQSVSQFSAKLNFDAIFDNTDVGEDVRNTTSRVANFLRPAPPADGATQDSGASAPALVLFHWGAFRFQGVLNQYKETIDFFSKEGVPLRATLSLGLTEQGPKLPDDPHAPTANTGGALVPTGALDSALAVATRGGNPAAARALASANNLESLRSAPPSASLAVNVGAAQTSAAASLVASGPSVSARLNTSGSGDLFNAQSSAGVSASAGAFAGVSSGGAGVSARSSLNVSTILSGGMTADVSAHAGASFSLGGAAQMGAGSGLSANVGAKASWKDLLQFDGD